MQIFKLEAAENAFIETQNKRTTKKNLLQMNDALDAFYLINKLNCIAAILHYKKFLSLEADVKMFSETLAHLYKNNYEHVPAIAIYLRIVRSLMQPNNEEHFHELKKLLEKNYVLFPKPTVRNVYAFAVNFCIRKINYGKLEYVKELFALYKQMLRAELMFDSEGNMSQFDYKNIVTVSLRASEPQWTERFTPDYKNYIPKADRQNAYTFNLAKLYFYRKQYNKVLPLLQGVVYSDIFYQLDSKQL